MYIYIQQALKLSNHKQAFELVCKAKEILRELSKEVPVCPVCLSVCLCVVYVHKSVTVHIQVSSYEHTCLYGVVYVYM